MNLKMKLGIFRWGLFAIGCGFVVGYFSKTIPHPWDYIAFWGGCILAILAMAFDEERTHEKAR